MKYKSSEYLRNEFGISENVIKLTEKVEEDIKEIFDDIDAVKEHNQFKVMKAMQKNKLSDSHFAGTTGYGYDDRGREVLDSVYADVFKAEDALVRHQIVSGTHALSLCLFGNLRPGDEILSVTGKPYDTLEEVIGIRGEGGGSLKEFGVGYRQVDLLEDGSVDFEGVKRALNAKTRVVLIQRSRGYSWRSSFKISDIEHAISLKP